MFGVESSGWAVGRSKIKASWCPGSLKSSLGGSADGRVAISRPGGQGAVWVVSRGGRGAEPLWGGVTQYICWALCHYTLNSSNAGAKSWSNFWCCCWQHRCDLQLQRAHVTAVFCWQPPLWEHWWRNQLQDISTLSVQSVQIGLRRLPLLQHTQPVSLWIRVKLGRVLSLKWKSVSLDHPVVCRLWLLTTGSAKWSLSHTRGRKHLPLQLAGREHEKTSPVV